MINKYPYTDFHELNADWLLTTVKEAADEAGSMNDRVTAAESDIADLQSDVAPIKAAMPGIASDISDLRRDSGIISSLINSTITPAVETLQSEVETPTTGLLDRVTALENTPTTGGVTEYLKFSSDSTPFDYDGRITYSYLVNLIGTSESVDKNYNIILVEDDELGTTWYYSLNEGEYQISAGTPRGQFTFVCRKPVISNNTLTGYKVCTVTVNRNAASPAYSEEFVAALPAVTSSDYGSFLAVNENGNWGLDVPSVSPSPIQVTSASNIEIVTNCSKRNGNTVIIDFSFRTLNNISANDYIITTQLLAPGNSVDNYFVSQSDVPVSQRMKLTSNGYLLTAEAIAQGVTIVINYRYEVI